MTIEFPLRETSEDKNKYLLQRLFLARRSIDFVAMLKESSQIKLQLRAAHDNLLQALKILDGKAE